MAIRKEESTILALFNEIVKKDHLGKQMMRSMNHPNGGVNKAEPGFEGAVIEKRSLRME